MPSDPAGLAALFALDAFVLSADDEQSLTSTQPSPSGLSWAAGVPQLVRYDDDIARWRCTTKLMDVVHALLADGSLPKRQTATTRCATRASS